MKITKVVHKTENLTPSREMIAPNGKPLLGVIRLKKRLPPQKKKAIGWTSLTET